MFTSSPSPEELDESSGPSSDVNDSNAFWTFFFKKFISLQVINPLSWLLQDDIKAKNNQEWDICLVKHSNSSFVKIQSLTRYDINNFLRNCICLLYVLLKTRVVSKGERLKFLNVLNCVHKRNVSKFSYKRASFTHTGPRESICLKAF